MTNSMREAAVCIGESMTLLTPSAGHSLMDAQSLEMHVAGAEGNVACGLAHLGVSVEWLSRVGDDPMGARILDFLRSRGVGVRWSSVDPARPTGVMFKDRTDRGSAVHYYRRDSAASAMGVEVLEEFDTPRLVHLSGITPALSDSLAALAEELLTKRALGQSLVSFDVNHRAALWSADQAAEPLGRMADLADVVLVGQDEAERLWGCTTPEQVRERLPGAAVLVVKDAERGAWHLEGVESVFQPALPLEVVDIVGAGDAFAAGYLAGLLTGSTPAVRLRLGHLLAALTIQSTADTPRLPDAEVLWELAETGADWDRISITPAALEDAELLRGKESR